MSDSLDKTIAELNKKYGANTIGKLNDLTNLEIERISTGSSYMDWATGGGFPRGRIIELFGPYSSGKTLTGLRTVAAAQKEGLKCVWVDAENSFDPSFAKVIGVNPKELIVTQTSGAEDVFNIIDKLLDTGVALIVIDSVAALSPQYEMDEPMEKQTIGLQARVMSKGLRKITGRASANKTTVLFINQIREKPTTYGNPETTAGGRALAFYASLRIDVRKGEASKEEEKITGQQVKFKVVKSKVCPPMRDGYFMFFYPDPENPELELFDTADELVSMLLIQNKIVRRGAYYDVAGRTFQGREEMEQEIRTNQKFRDDLTKIWKGN